MAGVDASEEGRYALMIYLQCYCPLRTSLERRQR